VARYVRKQLLSSVNLLKNAGKTIEQIIKQEEYAEAGELFLQCQQCAITMGNTIESYIGEGSDSVRLLEEYCELLYRLSQYSETNAAAYQLLDGLQAHIRHLDQAVSHDMTDRLEVVFLPYKASMWDSLESIWQTACDDKNADTVVLPITYYEKKADGSFGTAHNEADEFPDYVPVMNENDYNWKFHHPDIIFIHNPYDEHNRVTSIAPFYYSRNIKSHTEKLVYVPYFVLDGKKIGHFASLPGVLYSDFTIALNEEEKKSYIEEIEKDFPGLKTNINDKILPLGSSKFDKVCSINPDNVKIPEKWAEIIKGRKTILYNTSVSAMLENSEHYLRKMKEVFNTFRCQNDVIMIWRPHPLMETTIKSMRPEMYLKYSSLKESFISEKIGVYDDTPDMYTAIGISDAYYGDPSSLIWLYMKTGKPILIQKMNCK